MARSRTPKTLYALISLALLLAASALQTVEALGPAFNTVEKIPVIKPSRDYLPANYSHIMNLVFRFKDLPENQWRETGIATTLLHDDTVRAYAYNRHNNRLVIADLNLVTLEKKVRYRILQYYNITRPGGGLQIEIDGSRYPVLEHFKSGRSFILGSIDTPGGIIIATLGASQPSLNVYEDSEPRVYRRATETIVVTRLNGGDAETYLLDLGAVFDRGAAASGKVINTINPSLSGSSSGGRHVSAVSFSNGKMLVAQVSLAWPNFRIVEGGRYFDYVTGEARRFANRSELLSFLGRPGIILASVNLENMTIGKAAYLYAPGYNLTAEAVPTGDEGFLALLVGWDSAVVVKVERNFSVSWATQLEFPYPLINYTGGIYPRYQEAFRLAEAGDGYAVLLPLLEKPVLVFLDSNGTVRWSAYLNTTLIEDRYSRFQGAQLSASGDMIYVVWYAATPGSSIPASWITLMTTEGEVIGSYRNNNRIGLNKDLFGEVHGELGRTKTILCRPDGYATLSNRPRGYMDVAYLLDDYETMELGSPSPFRGFEDNDDALEKGEGWSVALGASSAWLNASYSFNGTHLEAMRDAILVKTGSTVRVEDMELRAVRVATVIEDPGTVEFIPSFYYPLAITPDEVDFGQVHVGEEKAVDVEVIWLTQSPDTSEAIAWHNIRVDDPSFRLDEEGLREALWKKLAEPDIDVGKRIRIRLYFKPRDPGPHTGILGLGQGPLDVYVWSPIGFDWPRQTLPVRGIGVAEDEPIKIGDSPVSLGLSASYISMPPFILPGSSYRESIYITNIGNAEAVFIHGILVLPGSTVITVKGADEVIGLGNESLDPFFATVLKIKPLETRRIDIYMKVTAELADPESPYRKLGLERAPHGAVPMEIAALPPALWEKAWSQYKESEAPHLVVDAALRMYNDYLASIVMNLARMPEDELNDALVRLWESNPYLADYLDIVSFKMAMGNWTYNETVVAMVLGASGEELKADNTAIRPGGGVLRLEPLLLDLHESGEPGLLWYVREFFKPKEFLETSAQGLIGLGKGVLKAVTFDLVDLEAENEYQAVGKTIGYVAANVELFLMDGLSIGKAVHGLEYGLKKAAINLAIAGRNTLRVWESGVKAFKEARMMAEVLNARGVHTFFKLFKFEIEEFPLIKWEVRKAIRNGREVTEVVAKQLASIKIPKLKLLDNYKTLIGFEYEFLGKEGKTIYGNLIKIAENKKFGGFYIGIGYTTDRVINVGGKLIHPGDWHYYILSGKLSVYNPITKTYVERHLPILQPLFRAMKELAITTFWTSTAAVLTTGLGYRTLKMLSPLWQDLYHLVQMSYGDSLSGISFSADPNELRIRPSPYVRSLDSDIYVQVHFENLANATAPAYNITLKIYLEGPINASTIDVWDASHPEAFDGYNVSVEDGRIAVAVRFTNITLPPNRNPPEGEGWVTLKLRLLGDARPGDSVRAYADVYFDYNPPVRTNTASTTYDPDPPKLSINASAEPGKLRARLTCLDDVSGCNFTALMLLKGEDPLAAETLLEPGPGGVYEVSLEPGTYTLVAMGFDNAGNLAWSNTTINVPGATTTTPHTETTTTATTSTTGLTTTSTTTHAGRRGIPAWIYPSILLAVAAAVLAVRLRRTED